MPPSLRHSLINTVDDSRPVDAITANALATWGELFASGGWDTELSHKGLPGAHEYAWTGIIGMTPDAVPFVGPIPGKEGQYVAAGYNGHGEYERFCGHLLRTI
jgi:glycine/D-amino acid oxidase-like deaminating enzyme